MDATPSLEKPVVPELIKQKLKAFKQLQSEFEASFRFAQDVQGQKRFPAFPVDHTVRYLHALWICECKDRLLSIYKNIQRYEGHYCLELLRGWQEGDTAGVVTFLHGKLDMLPLPDITRQLQEVRLRQSRDGLLERLEHGRKIMLNRGFNLFHALDAIFALPDNELIAQVQAACTQYEHAPAQIEQQLAEMETPLYSYMPHQLLARQNMIVMNKLGIDVMNKPADQPGQRSWRVLKPTEPLSPFAEHVILGYQELTSPLHNNIRGDRFVDRPERSDEMEV
jgi:hypothetical protein